jgi:DNA-binding CsgD family transcriptional regulator
VLEPIDSSQPATSRLRRLSPRETEVLAAASLGLSNAEIAQQLGVTIHAIKFHLALIYKKLGVSNRTEASSLYVRSMLAPAEAG